MHASPTRLIVAGVIGWLILASVGPTLIELMRAAVPLVIAVGVVFAVLRLVLFHTRRW